MWKNRLTRQSLPNGLYAYEPRAGNAQLIYPDIVKYFAHGLDLQEGDTVFDVGAHIGLFSLEVLRRSNGRARVYCFEPSPETHGYLTRNLTEQFPASSVHIHRCALAARPGQTTLFYRPLAPHLTGLCHPYLDLENLDSIATSWAHPSVFAEYRDGLPRWMRYLPRFMKQVLFRRGIRQAMDTVQPMPCELRTISDVMREQHITAIDLLKVDVEGGELDVLNGIEDQDWPNIHKLLMEVHDYQGRLEYVRALLRRHDFQEVSVTQDGVFKGTPIHSLWASR